MANKTYLCIDLKSFYASVECASRGLDPLTTNLVVADESRTEKTICLAVSPSLKKYGIPGRARLFEVNEKVKKINFERAKKIIGGNLKGESYDEIELSKKPAYKLSFICATPRMSEYIKISSKIYSIYLKYVSKEDIHVYSIDEVFIDLTSYLNMYNKTPREIAYMMIKDVLNETKITATAGIGTNMYLAKVAMDIDAKHMEADKFGVRISELDEISYRKRLWDHKPITDFWRIGRGVSQRLAMLGIQTMGELARFSLKYEALLYDYFGVNAELIIDHAWGYEPTEMKDVKSYKPESNSYSVGQVIHCAMDFEKTRLIVREMSDQMSLDLLEKGVVTNHITLSIGYDIENINYNGEYVYDYLGRKVPKPAHGSINLDIYTSSTQIICEAIDKLYLKIVDPNLLSRRINIAATIVKNRENINHKEIQLDIFTDYDEIERKNKSLNEQLKKEESIQKAIIDIKKKHGKNKVLKGMNLEEGATMKDRNEQIGGHKA